MKLVDIKPYLNIENALYQYKLVTNGKSVKFKAPSRLSNWENRILKCLMMLKFLRTINTQSHIIRQKYNVTQDLKLFMESYSIKVSEDRSNYRIKIAHGSMPYSTEIQTYLIKFNELCHEMRYSGLPDYQLERINTKLNDLAARC